METLEKEPKPKEFLIHITKEELDDIRKRGHIFPPKTEQVINAIMEGVENSEFTLDEVGTSKEELRKLLQKAGIPGDVLERIPQRRRALKIDTVNQEREDLYDIKEERWGAYRTSYLDTLEEAVTGRIVEGVDEPSSFFPFRVEKIHFKRNIKLEEFYKELLKNKDVLDLGCGICASGYNIADHCGAKSYTGVELFFAKTAYKKILEAAKFEDSIPFNVIQEDVVDFVYNPSVKADVVFLTGIDENIIPDYEWERLMKGLNSILKKEGTLILGGGGQKPWDIINKYFDRRDEEWRSLVTMEEDMMLPSIFVKK